jgi:hypothetical protein
MKIFEQTISQNLSPNDDINLWLLFFEIWKEDFQLNQSKDLDDYEIFLQIGACSHWLRPHQTRLTAAGGFAYPVGYGGNSTYSRSGKPEFDWSVLFHFDKIKQDWFYAEKQFGMNKLVCRVALPNRTIQHNQAVANVIWLSGTPQNPKEKSKIFYAFRKVENIWKFIKSGEI